LRGDIGFERDMVGSRSALGRTVGAGEIDEHPAHRSRRDGQKVPAVLPVDPMRVRQADERFVHERGGLERVAGPLAPHVVSRLTPQLGVEQ
jgi:hypothetical protein